MTNDPMTNDPMTNDPMTNDPMTNDSMTLLKLHRRAPDLAAVAGGEYACFYNG